MQQVNRRRLSAWIIATVSLWGVVGGKVYSEHLRVRERMVRSGREDRAWSTCHERTSELMVSISRLVVTWRNLAANDPDRERFALGWSQLDELEADVAMRIKTLRNEFSRHDLSASRIDKLSDATIGAIPVVRKALEEVRHRRTASAVHAASELVVLSEHEAVSAVRRLIGFVASEHDAALSLREQLVDVDHTWTRNSYAFLFVAGALVSALGLWLSAAAGTSENPTEEELLAELQRLCDETVAACEKIDPGVREPEDDVFQEPEDVIDLDPDLDYPSVEEEEERLPEERPVPRNFLFPELDR